MSDENPVAVAYSQLLCCEQRLFQAKGVLSVLNKAVELDEVRGSADDGYGYSEVIDYVQLLLQAVSEDVETAKGRLYRHDPSAID